MKPIVPILLLLLAGCASAPAAPRAFLPTPVFCHPNLGPEPAYPDTDAALKAAPDLFEWGRLLVDGRLMRIQRDAEKSAALKECEGPS